MTRLNLMPSRWNLPAFAVAIFLLVQMLAALSLCRGDSGVLLMQRDRLAIVDTDGVHRVLTEFSSFNSRAASTLGDIIYVILRSNVVTFDSGGTIQDSFPLPTEVSRSGWKDFVPLPDQRFAFLDSKHHRVLFIDQEGRLKHKVPLDSDMVPGEKMQRLCGVVVDGCLMVALGTQCRLVEIDLATFGVSGRHDLSELEAISGIAYADGRLYLCDSGHIYEYTIESAELRPIVSVPDAKFTSVAVFDDKLVALSDKGKAGAWLYEVEIDSGAHRQLGGKVKWPVGVHRFPLADIDAVPPAGVKAPPTGDSSDSDSRSSPSPEMTKAGSAETRDQAQVELTLPIAPREAPPKRPEVRCHLVAINVFDPEGSSPVESVVEGLPLADGPDIVALPTISRPGAIFWLHSDGSIGGIADSEKGRNILKEVAAWGEGYVKLLLPHGSLVALRQDGSVRTTGKLAGALPLEQPAVTDITYVYSSLVTLNREGTVHWYGDEEFRSEARREGRARLSAEQGRIARIHRHRAILRDGTLIKWLGDPSADVMTGVADFASAFGCVQLTNGRWAFSPPGSDLSAAVKELSAVDIVAGGVLQMNSPYALRLPGSKWQVWPRVSSPTRPLRGISNAIDGAVQVHLVMGEKPTLLALLPEETVSRGGHWKVSELLKDRAGRR